MHRAEDVVTECIQGVSLLFQILTAIVDTSDTGNHMAQYALDHMGLYIEPLMQYGRDVPPRIVDYPGLNINDCIQPALRP